jgi:hypothetical protein
VKKIDADLSTSTNITVASQTIIDWLVIKRGRILMGEAANVRLGGKADIGRTCGNVRL